MGLPLHYIKDIRLLYGESPWGTTDIDFDTPRQKPQPWGHVIAARITSENPDEGKIFSSSFHIHISHLHLFGRIQTQLRHCPRAQLQIVQECLGLLLGGGVRRSSRVRRLPVWTLLLLGRGQGASQGEPGDSLEGAVHQRRFPNHCRVPYHLARDQEFPGERHIS